MGESVYWCAYNTEKTHPEYGHPISCVTSYGSYADVWFQKYYESIGDTIMVVEEPENGWPLIGNMPDDDNLHRPHLATKMFYDEKIGIHYRLFDIHGHEDWETPDQDRIKDIQKK